MPRTSRLPDLPAGWKRLNLSPPVAFLLSVILAVTIPFVASSIAVSGWYALDLHILEFELLMWVMSLVAILVLTALPFGLAYYISALLRAGSVWFWTCAGALSGLVPCLVWACWATSSLPLGDPDHISLLAAIMRFGPFALLLGLLAGAFYGLVAEQPAAG